MVGDVALGGVIGAALMGSGMLVYRTCKDNWEWRRQMDDEWKATMVKRGNAHDDQIAALRRRVEALEEDG